MSTIEDLRDQITREERVVNLRADGTVTAEEIQRRRRQMFLLAVVVLVGLLFTTVANDVWTQFRDGSWIDPEIARLALIGFGVCSAVYLYDKEQHLKRLSRLGRDVQDLDVGPRRDDAARRVRRGCDRGSARVARARRGRPARDRRVVQARRGGERVVATRG